jgi:hypothetical protein
MSVDKLVVSTKKKMDIIAKESFNNEPRRNPMTSSKYASIELAVGSNNFDPNNRYDTEGVDQLLGSERAVLEPDDINLKINKVK